DPPVGRRSGCGSKELLVAQAPCLFFTFLGCEWVLAEPHRCGGVGLLLVAAPGRLTQPLLPVRGWGCCGRLAVAHVRAPKDPLIGSGTAGPARIDPGSSGLASRPQMACKGPTGIEAANHPANLIGRLGGSCVDPLGFRALELGACRAPI